jgi:hypothetical protein
MSSNIILLLILFYDDLAEEFYQGTVKVLLEASANLSSHVDNLGEGIKFFYFYIYLFILRIVEKKTDVDL